VAGRCYTVGGTEAAGQCWGRDAHDHGDFTRPEELRECDGTVTLTVTRRRRDCLRRRRVTYGTALASAAHATTSPVVAGRLPTVGGRRGRAGAGSDAHDHGDLHATTRRTTRVRRDGDLTVTRRRRIVYAAAAVTYGTGWGGAADGDDESVVAGTFAYTVGGRRRRAVLGGRTRHGDFTPTDTTNYASATATVTLTVTPATPALSTRAGGGDVWDGAGRDGSSRRRRVRGWRTLPNGGRDGGGRAGAGVGRTRSRRPHADRHDELRECDGDGDADGDAGDAGDCLRGAGGGDLWDGAGRDAAHGDDESVVRGRLPTRWAGRRGRAGAGVGTHTITATFTPTDPTNYASGRRRSR